MSGDLLTGARRRLRVAGYWLLVAGPGVLFLGCGVSPLTNQINAGEDPFVIAVGEGPDSLTDLYAAPAGGGRFVRVTFNRPEERFPRLSPDGSMVAFLRAAGGTSGPPWSLVVLSLINSSESAASLPANAGEPERLGWTRNGAGVVLYAGSYFFAKTPPERMELRPVPADSVALADSLSRELLGEPPQGMILACPNGGLCVFAEGGQVTPLDSAARGAVRWSADSLGYFLPGGFEVRPLSGGRPRRPVWSGAPSRVRQLTHHPGVPRTGGSPSGIR